MSAKSSWGRIAVLAGGWSKERSISLKGGRAVHSALQAMAYDAFLIDLLDAQSTMQMMRKQAFDCAFILMHGEGGKDGCIQSMLESIAKPYTGSGVLSSALTMNKVLTKNMWRDMKLPTPPWQMLWPGFNPEEIVSILGLPLIVKPVDSGSSFGISLVNRLEVLPEAHLKALDGVVRPVMAESYIDGDEYSVAFVGDKVFPPIRITPVAPKHTQHLSLIHI